MENVGSDSIHEKSIELVIDHFELLEFKRNFIRKDGDEYVCDGQRIRNAKDESISVKFKSMEHTYEIFSLMGNVWGDWNGCPDWTVMKQKAKEWYEYYGAELTRVAHDTLVFQCKRKLTENEVETLIKDISHFAPNSLDFAKHEMIRKNLAEEGTFVLWWD